jgi:hypothetical protein
VQGKGLFSGLGDWWKKLTQKGPSKEEIRKENLEKLRIVKNEILGIDSTDEAAEENMFDYKDADTELLLKNMQGLRQVQKDFGNFNVKELYMNNFMADDVGASFNAIFGAKDKRIGNHFAFNQKLYRDYLRGENKGGRRKDGRYGHSIAGQEYTGVHEAGHAVNAELMDKLYNITNPKNRLNEGKTEKEILSTDYYKDLIGHKTSSIILQDAVMRAYETDKEFRKKMDKQAGARFWDSKATRWEKVSDLTYEDKSLSKDTQWSDWLKGYSLFDKGSKDIKKNLYAAGYTSQYGTTNSAELYAEAFADYYSTKDKNEAYKKKGSKKREKENPLSKAIVEITKELFENEEKRNAFKNKNQSTYYYAPPPSGT